MHFQSALTRSEDTVTFLSAKEHTEASDARLEQGVLDNVVRVTEQGHHLLLYHGV